MSVPAPEPRPDPAPGSDPHDGDPPDRGTAAAGAREVGVLDPDPGDPGIERLRALLQAPGGWRSRIDAAGLGAGGWVRPSARAVALVVVAAALGGAAFLVVGRGGESSIDPVQVLPRVSAPGAVAAPSPASSGPVATAEPATDPSGAPPGSAPAQIRVHAAGAVAVPGVHQLDPDARVADLIEAAGGSTPDADPDRVNLAAPVHDGERVYVPRLGETVAPEVVAGGAAGTAGGGGGPATSAGGGSEATASTPPARVDLNLADATALDTLPGVGPATAAAIIRHRTERGPFRSVDDLQEVPGIGPAKLAALRDLVVVG